MVEVGACCVLVAKDPSVTHGMHVECLPQPDCRHSISSPRCFAVLLLCCAVQIDRLYQWKSAPDCPVRDAFKRQKPDTMKEFETRSNQVFLQLNEQVSVGRCWVCLRVSVCVCLLWGMLLMVCSAC